MEKENRLHVLYILTKLELGGAQKVCLSLLKGISKYGLKSSLISGSEGVLTSEVQTHNSVFFLKSFKREVGIKTIFSEFKTFFQMISQIKKLKKQSPNLIIHTHSTKAGIMGRWAAFFAGVKTRIHTVHGFGFHDHQLRIIWLIHFILEYLTSFITTHYVCVSNLDMQTGNRLLHNFAKKSSIIRAAVEWDKFYQDKFYQDKFYQLATSYKTTHHAPIQQKNLNNKFIFGTVSCLKPQKNIFDLLQAFQYMHDRLLQENQQQVLLQIIGDGTLRKKVEQWITQNNLSTKIELLGWQNDVAKWMKKWHAFVMSSLWEGLPCAIVEARLSKLPVITYNIGGIPEVIHNNENGFLIKPGDWKTLAHRMKTLIQNKNTYMQMSINQEDLSDFKNSTMIKKHTSLYNQLSSTLSK